MRAPSAVSRLLLPALALLPLGAGCTTGPEEERYVTIDEEFADELRPYYEFERQKSELYYLGYEPQDFAFEDQGTVTVSEWALQGWPGEAYVSARITFKNTSDKPLRHAFVWLEVLDRADQVLGSGGARLLNPLGYPLWPGDTVTREIRAPTHGAHLDEEGWQWTIACETSEQNTPAERLRLVVPQNPTLPRPYHTDLPGGPGYGFTYNRFHGELLPRVRAGAGAVPGLRRGLDPGLRRRY